ncbi:MAG TPA: hypothetical protein VHW70_08410, partial [Edaphobacter sp.]|nr:hypothetical protein [Edaphobacter sp.]
TTADPFTPLTPRTIASFAGRRARFVQDDTVVGEVGCFPTLAAKSCAARMGHPAASSDQGEKGE